jgi:hypothetical protein
MQKLAPTHDTPLRALATAPVGLGEETIDQALPFQLSTNVTSPPPETVDAVPTAVHFVDEVQDTLRSWVRARDCGADCTVQELPSQRSINGDASCSVGVGQWLFVPTAVHAVDAVHDAAARLLS